MILHHFFLLSAFIGYLMMFHFLPVEPGRASALEASTSSSTSAGNHPGASTELKYSISEELAERTLIADIVRDAGIGATYPPEVRLRYKFLTTPTIAMSLNETTGKIFTNGRIDREAICGGGGGGGGRGSVGGLQSSGQGGEEVCRVRQDVMVHPIQYFKIVKLIVDILDINDNSPEFAPAHLTHEWIESTQPGASFVIPTARDSDTRANSINEYKVFDPSDTVKLRVSRKLDGSTEVRMVLEKLLDRETREVYKVKVIAFDAGSPPRSGSCDITIVVLDSNDNVPVFAYNSYEVTVTENLAPLTTVVRVSANDLDVGQNARILYSLSSGTQTAYGDVFAVNDVTGDVYVIGEVDHEKAPVYHLIVTAQDGGTEAGVAETTVAVTVEDFNDNAPAITVNTLLESDTSSADVAENVPRDTFVGHVIVRDLDKGQNGRFNCSVDDGRHFRLHQVFAREYHLVTSSDLDRESRDRYDVTITCVDGGVPSLNSSKHVTIRVTDMNDNLPKFEEDVYLAELLENNYIGAAVTQVSATDLDLDSNAVIRYRLEFPAPVQSDVAPGISTPWIGESAAMDKTPFSIDTETGLIVATAPLDYERQKEYSFRVVAENSGAFVGDVELFSVANVTVKVLDVNDESPRFSADTYELKVEENKPTGAEVGYLRVSDADGPAYNNFRLSVMSGGSLSDAFIISQKSGKVVTARELDREDQDRYSFVALATDENNPALTSSATVIVKVLDVNDHAPIFAYPTSDDSIVHIDTSFGAGQLVATVHATDADEGQNAEIVYVIIKGNDFQVFDLNDLTGELTLTRDLRPSVDNGTHNLVITASDNGFMTSSKTFAYLTVTITNGPAVYHAGGQYGGGDGKGRGNLWVGGGVLTVGDNLPAVLVVGGITIVIIVVLVTAIAAVLCGGDHSDGCCSKSSSKGAYYNCRTDEAVVKKASAQSPTNKTNGQHVAKHVSQKVLQSEVTSLNNISKVNVNNSTNVPGYKNYTPLIGTPCSGAIGSERVRDARHLATENSTSKKCNEGHSDYSSDESLISTTFKRCDVRDDILPPRDVISGGSVTSDQFQHSNNGMMLKDELDLKTNVFESQIHPRLAESENMTIGSIENEYGEKLVNIRSTSVGGDSDSGRAMSLANDVMITSRTNPVRLQQHHNIYHQGQESLSVRQNASKPRSPVDARGKSGQEQESCCRTLPFHNGDVTNPRYVPLTLQHKSKPRLFSGTDSQATPTIKLTSFTSSKHRDKSVTSDVENNTTLSPASCDWINSDNNVTLERVNNNGYNDRVNAYNNGYFNDRSRGHAPNNQQIGVPMMSYSDDLVGGGSDVIIGREFLKFGRNPNDAGPFELLKASLGSSEFPCVQQCRDDDFLRERLLAGEDASSTKLYKNPALSGNGQINGSKLGTSFDGKNTDSPDSASVTASEINATKLCAEITTRFSNSATVDS